MLAPERRRGGVVRHGHLYAHRGRDRCRHAGCARERCPDLGPRHPRPDGGAGRDGARGRDQPAVGPDGDRRRRRRRRHPDDPLQGPVRQRLRRAAQLPRLGWRRGDAGGPDGRHRAVRGRRDEPVPDRRHRRARRRGLRLHRLPLQRRDVAECLAAADERHRRAAGPGSRSCSEASSAPSGARWVRGPPSASPATTSTARSFPSRRARRRPSPGRRTTRARWPPASRRTRRSPARLWRWTSSRRRRRRATPRPRATRCCTTAWPRTPSTAAGRSASTARSRPTRRTRSAKSTTATCRSRRCSRWRPSSATSRRCWRPSTRG